MPRLALALPALLIVAPALAQDAPAPRAGETITVTATRTATRLADTPSSVVVLPEEVIASSAAVAVDDVLRQVPGFALFRRSGSRSANPTTQGVSLRGIGASGASRALVLDDGVPLNDPFGGWVYWGRIPRSSLARVEVLRGGASDLYGSGAMSGVVQFIRRPASVNSIVVDSSAGSQGTGTTSLFAAAGEGSWRGSVSADLFTTSGYVPVAREDRGAVDRRANSRHASFDATLERALGTSGRAFVRGAHYTESRNNGTELQTNDTTFRQASAGIDSGAAHGFLTLRGYASDQDYAQTFSAIAADRNSERLTVDQRVPSRSLGGSGQWFVAAEKSNAIVAGGEMRRVSGTSEEEQFTPRGTSNVSSGGVQTTSSAFVQDVIAAGSALSITAALRFDGWRNHDAQRNGEPLVERHDSAVSPHLSILYRATDRLSLVASAYRAFRAPTLNELYRGFRVGNVLTLANEALGPERLRAFEAGARFGGVRATAYVMSVDDTIANVTLSSAPALITRQRQNLGSTRTRGLELESETHPARLLRLSASYLFADAVVTDGQLSRKRLPQVPRHQASLQATFTPGRATLAIQTRWSAMQYDDDLNELRLRGYLVADAFASWPLTSRIAVTVAGENLFDRRIEVSATPVVSYAAPRALRAGLRYSR